ncbi:MAG: lipid-binding SYLF domain-containing protein [Verrucomicrobiales bacterium]|nr:lipid-binding SYLF domain-containing protein [Verrucomicrobiales bacterium]
MINRKIFLPSLIILAFSTLQAGPFKKNEAQLDAKIIEAQARLATLQADPKKAIPPIILNRARGIIILRQLKAGLGFGAEAGGGVALVRRSDGVWSPPAFVNTAHASWGVQIGAQDKDIVMVLMTEKGLDLLKDGKRGDIGVEYQATVGPVDVGADLDTNQLSPILIYSSATGGFAGISLKGGGIVGAKNRNQTYYGMTLQQILFSGKAPVSKSSANLIRSIQKAANP